MWCFKNKVVLGGAILGVLVLSACGDVRLTGTDMAPNASDSDNNEIVPDGDEPVQDGEPDPIDEPVEPESPDVDDPVIPEEEVVSSPFLAEAGLCQIPDNPRLSVTRGTDLMRITLDDYPQALCNDGTPALLYVSPAPEGSPDADKWILWLEGGGSCHEGESCAARWCGEQGIYTAAKMSSTYAPDGIVGNGIFERSPGGGGQQRNAFAGYNMVVAYYCSSDSWSGRTLQEVTGLEGRPDYALHLKGAFIVDAMVDLLKKGALSDDGEQRLPSLDEASLVIFSGTSAGGGGARFNADRVGEMLRETNAGVDYRLVVDAGFHPSDKADEPLVSQDRVDEMLERKWEIMTHWREAELDASCMAFHTEDAGHAAGDLFQAWDLDGDGLITREEWGGTDAVFSALDTNGDGLITPAEMAAGLGVAHLLNA